MQEYTYSPHLDFYIDEKIREPDFEMGSFHIHHKYELYYQVAGSRRYFIEDAAYVVNAGNLVLIGENQIHKTGPLGDGPTRHSRSWISFLSWTTGRPTCSPLSASSSKTRSTRC